MNAVEFAMKVEPLVDEEVALWDQFEVYVQASYDADKTPEEAADEVTAQYEEHGC